MTDAVTQKDRQSGAMVDPVQAVRLVRSEVRALRRKPDGDRNTSREARESTLARKGASSIPWVPVPQTDTGGRGENPKTNGRTLVKELGKMTP